MNNPLRDLLRSVSKRDAHGFHRCARRCVLALAVALRIYPSIANAETERVPSTLETLNALRQDASDVLDASIIKDNGTATVARATLAMEEQLRQLLNNGETSDVMPLVESLSRLKRTITDAYIAESVELNTLAELTRLLRALDDQLRPHPLDESAPYVFIP